MPLNPWENMPEDLRKQNGVGYHLCNNFTGKRPDGHTMELKDSSAKFSPKKSLEIADGTSIMASTKYPWIALNEQAKVTCFFHFVYLLMQEDDITNSRG